MTPDTAALYDATHQALGQAMESDGAVRRLNETETRQHVIDPVLHALGYRSLDQVPLVTYALKGCAADPSGFALHWVIAGIQDEHCFSGDSACAEDARVGEVLPESCGGPHE